MAKRELQATVRQGCVLCAGVLRAVFGKYNIIDNNFNNSLCTVILFFKKAELYILIILIIHSNSRLLFIHIYKETENNLLKENSDIYICMGCKNCLKKYKYL